MKTNRTKKTQEVVPSAQIRVSKRLAEQIKISAALNKMSMVEMANLLISTGIGILKK